MTSTTLTGSSILPLNNLNSLTITSSLNTNSNDSTHNLSSASSNASTNTLTNLNKVLETQPKSTDSGIGSEKSCTPDNLNKKLPFVKDDVKKQQHNGVEKKRKDQINIWIKNLSELIPTVDPIKESKNKILEKAYLYIKELKDTNQKLILAKTPETQVNEIKSLYQRVDCLERTNSSYLSLLQSAGINPPVVQQTTELWNSKPTKYSNKLSQDVFTINSAPIDNTAQSNSKKKNNKKTANNKNQQTNQLNSLGNGNKSNLTTPSTQPMIVMNDQNQFQLLSNQSQLVNSQPTTNYQLLPNGQLCSTGDSLTAATNSAGNLIQPGQIIISQPFINQQPTTSAILLPNGQLQLVPVVQNQPFQNQPNLIYHTNSGIMLTNSVANSVTTNTSVNNQTNQTQPQNSLAPFNQTNTLTSTSNTVQLNKMNSNFSVNTINSTTSAILNKTPVITNTTNSMQNNNLTLDNLNASNSSVNNNQNNSKSSSKSKKNTTPKTPKKNTAKTTNVDKPAKQTKSTSKKSKKANSSNNNSSNSIGLDLNSSVQMNEDNNLGRSMKDILATATASIFDLGKMDDMEMMGDYNETVTQPSTINVKPVPETNQTNTDLISCTISNVITDSISDSNGALKTSTPSASSQKTSKSTENSIMPLDEKIEPSNKKQKVDEVDNSVSLEATTPVLMNSSNNQPEMQDANINEDDNPTTDIDKILSMSNDQTVNEETAEHEEVNFDYIAGESDQLNENGNDQGNDNSFLSSLTNTADPLNDFLQKNEENSKNLNVDNLFGNTINQINETNTIGSVNQISHSISSLTTEKPNNSNYNENSKKPVDTFKQPSSIDLNQTQDTTIQPNTSSSSTTNTSSFLSYSAESLITNAQQTNPNKTIRPNISYSAESLIHSSSSCTTSLNSSSRDDQNANKKPIVNNFSPQSNLYNNSPVISPSNQLSQSPVDSHHSSRPPSNSMLSPHQATTSSTNHLNRSLNSVNNNLNNSFNKELNSDFLFHSNNDERSTNDNSSLFSSSAVNNNTSTASNQQQKHLYNQNRNLYNSTDHLLSGSSTTIPANQQQSNSAFFTQSFNPSTSLNSYQLNDHSNPILSPFNYKDPLNTSQASTNYQSSLISNQNKFTPANLFPSPMFQDPLLDSSSSRKNSSKRSNLSPNPVNKSSSNKKSANKLHQSAVQSNSNDYSSGVQSQQIPSNRQSQFYLDTPLANNPIGNDFMNTYFSMPDFSGSNSGTSASNTNTNKQLTTSSSAFTNQSNCNDNYFLRPAATQNSSSSFSLNSTNQLNSNQPIQNQTANRPNFNLSNIIPDIGQASSNSAALNTGRQTNFSTQNFFGTSSDHQTASSQFSGSNVHSFSNILNSSSGVMDSSNQQQSALHHLHTNSSNSSLNNLHRQPSHTNSTPTTDAASLYRSFNSTQIANQFSNQNNPMNSLNMPLGSNLSNSLNATQTTNGNSNLISQNMTANQNPYSSFSLPFI